MADDGTLSQADIDALTSGLLGAIGGGEVNLDALQPAMDIMMDKGSSTIEGLINKASKMTAMEIKVECRMSRQMPMPRYRAGLILYLNACKEGVFDKNFKPPFSQAELKRIDHSWQNAFREISLAEGVPIPDLESDDPKDGEYVELVEAAPPEVSK